MLYINLERDSMIIGIFSFDFDNPKFMQTFKH